MGLGSRVKRRWWLALLSVPAALGAQVTPPADETPIEIHRAVGPITIDGDLSDPGWQGATRIETFFETRPADNIPPKIRTIGYLTYDDKALYAAFECADPHPEQIRAPYVDRDNITDDTDYAGIILDTRHDRRTAIEFYANPRGVQYDAIDDDSSQTEDASIDLFWDSAGRIDGRGWTLEIRVPFSSLRYDGSRNPVWGIQFYRNRTRDTHYQYFSNRLPRSSNCFICHERDVVGLEGLPSTGHLIAAPYVTAVEQGRRVDPNDLSSRFVNRPARGNAGLDVKWLPNANTAIDAAVNPDFSQVESDVAQISVNNRFALFIPRRDHFSSRVWTSSRRPFKPSIPARSPRPAGGSGERGKSTRRTTRFSSPRTAAAVAWSSRVPSPRRSSIRTSLRSRASGASGRTSADRT